MLKEITIVIENAVLEDITSIVKPYYEAVDGNHSWLHIEASLANVDIIQNSNTSITSNVQLFKMAKLALLLHDLDRNGMENKIPDILNKTGVDKTSQTEILHAISNHNKPKHRWHKPEHELSAIVYDADKMDTSLERFSPTKLVNGVEEKTSKNDYFGYVLMVRDSTTSNLAREVLTEQLPKEIQVDPFDKTVTSDEMKAYDAKMRKIWDESNLPAKKTVAKYVLMTTGNPNFTAQIIKGFPPIEMDKIKALSPLRSNWIEYLGELETVANKFLSSLEALSGIADITTSEQDNIENTILEKLFVYRSFQHAVINYPTDKESDLLLLMNRLDHSVGMVNNFEYATAHLLPEQQKLDTEEIEMRREYYKNIISPKLNNLHHYSTLRNIDALKDGRRIMDQLVHELFEEHDEDSIISLIDKAVNTSDKKMADQIIRYYRQDSLRAVDRVNDSMRTDRFIYLLLEKQTTDAPVQRLPYIYEFQASEILSKGLHYYSPTHPQAFHAMKMMTSYENMPDIIEDSISFFTQGMYKPIDFENLYIDIFATLFDEKDIDISTFDFLFENVVVNEEAKVVKNVDGRFVTSNWLELDYLKRSNPVWKSANDCLQRINEFCCKIGIIPPIRPYAVVSRELATNDYANILDNPKLVV